MSSDLVPPTTHNQWKITLSCNAELTPTEKDIDLLAKIARKSDAVIHIIPYKDVKEDSSSAFNILSKVIQNNDSKCLITFMDSTCPLRNMRHFGSKLRYGCNFWLFQ